MKTWIAGWRKKLSIALTPGAADRRDPRKVVSRGLSRLGLQNSSTQGACWEAHELRQRFLATTSQPSISIVGQDKIPSSSEMPCVAVSMQPYLLELLSRLPEAERPFGTILDDMQQADSSRAICTDLTAYPPHEQAGLALFAEQLVPFSIRTILWAQEQKAAIVPIWACLSSNGALGLRVIDCIIAQGSVEAALICLLKCFEAQMRELPQDIDWTWPVWSPPASSLLFRRRGWPTLSSQSGERRPFRIAVRAPDDLREACLAVPAIRAIIRGRPDSAVTVFAEAESLGLWKVFAGAGEITEYGSSREAASQADGATFDLGVVLEGRPEHVTELRRLGCDRIVGMEQEGMIELLDDALPQPEKLGPIEHRQRVYLRVAHRLGAEVQRDADIFTPIRLSPTPSSRAIIIGVAPDSEEGPGHVWPRENYAAVIGSLVEFPEISWRVILPRDSDNATYWNRQARELHPVELRVQYASELVGHRLRMLSEFLAFVGGDTSLLQLASLLGIGTVGLFGPSDPVAVAPRHARAFTMHHHVVCSPCHLRQCPLDHRCMKAISVEEVLAALRALIQLQHLA